MTEHKVTNLEKVEKQKIERTELVNLLQNFSNLRTGQDQVLWSIVGAFWTANSVLFVSIFTADKSLTFFVGILISAIGISISWIWKQIQRSALKRIEYYESAIKKIEKELNYDYDLCAFLRQDSENYERILNKKSARYVLQQFSKYAIIFWISALVLFFGGLIYINLIK